MSERRQTITTADDDGLPVNEAVLDAVGDVMAQGPTDLAPLHRVIDPEALDDLLAPRPTGGTTPLGLQFEYSGCLVTVERREGDAVEVRVRKQAE